MYVVLLTYTAPLPEIDYALPDHAEWLSRQFELGRLLASGRRADHRGEVLLSRPMSLGTLEAALAGDPLLLRHLAHHEVIEFSATRTGPELRAINEALAG
ncbi:YciI family protein [Saccharomonospora xinjiangensis]|uniref:YciI family protein n=1 Tax=Saccharomonospora xinjiangensis TaxID=75294 RepID=UPI003510BF1C